MRIGELFAGIGGIGLGLEWAGVGSVAWQVERDPFCRRVLERHWPDAERFEDVRDVGAANLAPVDVIAGGFPCQDLSLAGKGAGLHGERSGMFWELARVVRELRPRFVVLENVSAILRRGVGDVLGTLAALGYDAEWCCVRASDVGAMHRRDRWFCVAWIPVADRERERPQDRDPTRPATPAIGGARPVADRDGGRREGVGLAKHGNQQGAPRDESDERRARRRGQGAHLADAGCLSLQRRTDDRSVAGAERAGTREGLQRQRGRRPPSDAGAARGTDAAGAPSQSLVGLGSHGISLWLDVAPPGADQHPWEPPRLVEDAPDRAKRLRALGNAVVPQVAALVGRRLLEIKEREGL